MCTQEPAVEEPAVTDSQNVADRAPSLPQDSVRRRLRGRNAAVESRIRRRVQQMPSPEGWPGAEAQAREIRGGGFDWRDRRLGRRPLIKVKAHQADGMEEWEMEQEEFDPNLFLIYGNKVADAGAERARRAGERAGFEQVRYPAGGFRFFLSW